MKTSILASAAAAALLAHRPGLVLNRRRGLVAVRAEAPADVKALIDAVNRGFEEFKTTNDARLKALETRGAADPVLTEKLERINGDVGGFQAMIDEINRKIAAANLGGGAGDTRTPEQRAYATAFDRFFRKGDGAEALKDLSVKAAMQTQSDPDGGYMVTPEMEKAIDRILQAVSAMRSIAQVRPISTGEYKKLVSQGGATAGWVGERQARPETNSPTLAELTFQAMELYAEPSATQTLLDDAYVDLGQWLGDEVSITFDEQEGAAFITGNGVAKPRGILSYATVDDVTAYTWGKIGYYKTGAAATFAADPNGLDALVNISQGLKRGYRNNAAWLMNRFTAGTVRKLKDSQGHYQWQPSTQIGQPGTLLGYPLVDDDNMPDVGAGAYPVAFGDWKRAYIIVDRMGVRVLRDPYTNKPHVMFYTTKRVGGGVQNFEAFKLLLVSA
jgi:HK97 family phage major capsid protein